MSAIEHSAQDDDKTTSPKFSWWIRPFLKGIVEKAPELIARHIPDGMRVYCVGDIHGRDDLLELMAERMKVDLKSGSFEQAVTVFLGDYIDRGFGSMRVLERLSRGEWPSPIIALAGNHEDLLLTFLRDEEILDAWRVLGGF